MNPEKLLVIAKKMNLPKARIVKGYVWFGGDKRSLCFPEMFIPGLDILKLMCHFRIWIDDKPDGSKFCAYHYTGQHKTEVLRDGPATPEGIVDAVLQLAYELSK